MTDEELKPLSDSELEFFRAQGGSVLVNEIDRLRAENRRLVEVCRWGLGYAQRVGDAYAERLFRAAIEKE